MYTARYIFNSAIAVHIVLLFRVALVYYPPPARFVQIFDSTAYATS